MVTLFSGDVQLPPRQTALRALVFNLRVLILVIDRLVHPKSFFVHNFFLYSLFCRSFRIFGFFISWINSRPCVRTCFVWVCECMNCIMFKWMEARRHCSSSPHSIRFTREEHHGVSGRAHRPPPLAPQDTAAHLARALAPAAANNRSKGGKSHTHTDARVRVLCL